MFHVGERRIRLGQTEVQTLGIGWIDEANVDGVLEITVALPELGPTFALGSWDHHSLDESLWIFVLKNKLKCFGCLTNPYLHE